MYFTKPPFLVCQLVIISFFIQGCSDPGSKTSDGASDQPIVFEESQNIPLNLEVNEGMVVKLDKRTVVYTRLNESRTEMVGFIAPLHRVHAGDTLEVGVDNFSEKPSNVDQGFVFMYEYEQRKDGNLTFGGNIQRFKQVAIWLAVSGSIFFEESSIKEGEHIKGHINDAVLKKVDFPTSYYVDYKGETKTYSGAFNVPVYPGKGVDQTVITDIEPVSGNLGTEITMRGFNIPKEKMEINFVGCENNFPYERISKNTFKFKITGFCDNMHFSVKAEEGSEGPEGYTTKTEFEFEKLPKFSKHPFPQAKGNISKIIYHRATNKVYILYDKSHFLYVYSVDKKSFVDSMELPLEASTFDINLDGNLIAIGSELDLYLLNSGFDIVTKLRVPYGKTIDDIFIAPNNEVLVTSTPEDPFESTFLGFLDVDEGKINYPPGLALAGHHPRNMHFFPSDDRKIVALQSAAYQGVEVELYRFEEEKNEWRKMGMGRTSNFDYIAFHPTKEEIWQEDVIYNYDMQIIDELDEILLLYNPTIVFSPEGKRYVVIEGSHFDIYDAETRKVIVSSIVFKQDQRKFENLRRFAFITDDKKDLFFLAGGNIFHYDYQDLVRWLDKEE